MARAGPFSRNCLLTGILLGVAGMYVCGCGVYTFSGSTLPGYLRTVDIPLFVNQTLQPGVAEDITQELTQQVVGSNLLRVVSAEGDATLSGVVRTYENREYFYDIKQARDVDVTEYVVRIRAAVAFVDNKKNNELYAGAVMGEGVYNTDTETEEDGRRRAVEDLVRQILEKSVQSW
jgi:hypothetical protein